MNNFKIILDCLKDLKQNHNELTGKYEKLADRLEVVERSNHKESGNNDNKEKIEIKSSEKDNREASRT